MLMKSAMHQNLQIQAGSVKKQTKKNNNIQLDRMVGKLLIFTPGKYKRIIFLIQDKIHASATMKMAFFKKKKSTSIS